VAKNKSKNKSKRRGSSSSLPSARRKAEFSKKLVIATGALFILSLFLVRADMREGYDISSYATQIILTTGGIFGASIVFYLNKAKIENLSKGKIRFMLLRLRLELRLKDQIPEEAYNLMLEEINTIDRMLDTKLDGALEEAIQQDIETQSY
jgi:hypothetical protein